MSLDRGQSRNQEPLGSAEVKGPESFSGGRASHDHKHLYPQSLWLARHISRQQAQGTGHRAGQPRAACIIVGSHDAMTPWRQPLGTEDQERHPPPLLNLKILFGFPELLETASHP